MLKLFIDTNVLVSATFWKRNPHKLIQSIVEGKAVGFTTSEMLDEYRAVLKRDFALTENEADERVENALQTLNVVWPQEHFKVIKDDPADDKVLEGAVQAEVDFIVSYDRHLRNLVTFRNIAVATPEEVLTKL